VELGYSPWTIPFLSVPVGAIRPVMRKMPAASLRCRIQGGTPVDAGAPGDTAATSRATLRRALGFAPIFSDISYGGHCRDGTGKALQGRSLYPMTLAGAVSICKVMLHDALKASVPVVRMGLQATDDLGPGGASLPARITPLSGNW